MKFLDDVVKYSPLGSVLIIFLSFIRQFFYYGQFSIDITNYISLTEFIVLFLKDSILIIGILTITFSFVLLMKNFKIIIEKYIGLNKVKRWLFFIIILVITISLNYFAIITLKSKSINHDANFFLVSLIISFSILILTSFIITIILEDKITKNKQLISGFFFAIILTLIIAINTSYQIKNEVVKNIYEIKQDSKTIITDDNLVKIGQTENYFFLYYKSEEMSLIIKTEDINEILIHSKVNK